MELQKNLSSQMDEQLVYAARVAEMVKANYSLQPKACVETYGCQQNVSDSEHI